MIDQDEITEKIFVHSMINVLGFLCDLTPTDIKYSNIDADQCEMVNEMAEKLSKVLGIKKQPRFQMLIRLTFKYINELKDSELMGTKKNWKKRSLIQNQFNF